MCKTNPFPRLRIVDCGLRIGDRPAAFGLLRPIVGNEPNLPLRGRPHYSRPMPFVRNEPNLPPGGIPHHSAIPSFQRSRPMPFVRNKANSERGQVVASAWWRKIYGGFSMYTAPAKQTQFSDRGGLPVLPFAADSAKQSQLAGANRAKRTQFLDCGSRIADWTRICGGTAPAPCHLSPRGAVVQTNPISPVGQGPGGRNA
jgi:hypothetical protein